MADIFNLGTPANATADTVSTNGVTSGARFGTGLDTGKLRRKFNFGDRVSELALSQDPFFRFVSKVGKKPTDDPSFKYTEKRGSWMKRYAYVSNHGTSAPAAAAGSDASVTHGNVDAGDTYYFTMITDYNSKGNLQNVYGQSSNEISPGDSDTQPAFFLPGQLVKIPYMTGVTAGSWTDASASAASVADIVSAV